MISVAETQAIVQHSLTALPPQRIALTEAAGLTLAENVSATLDIPPFAQSSMDGYAFRYADKESPLAIIGEMQAPRKASLFNKARRSGFLPVRPCLPAPTR